MWGYGKVLLRMDWGLFVWTSWHKTRSLKLTWADFRFFFCGNCLEPLSAATTASRFLQGDLLASQIEPKTLNQASKSPEPLALTCRHMEDGQLGHGDTKESLSAD